MMFDAVLQDLASVLQKHRMVEEDARISASCCQVFLLIPEL